MPFRGSQRYNIRAKLFFVYCVICVRQVLRNEKEQQILEDVDEKGTLNGIAFHAKIFMQLQPLRVRFKAIKNRILLFASRLLHSPLNVTSSLSVKLKKLKISSFTS